ncbi:MFS transporter [Nocardioides pyridinolyticus]
MAVIAIYATVLSGVTAPTPMWSTFQQRWELSDTGVTVLYALYPLGVLAVLPWAGALVDSWGRRRALAAGILASGLSSLLLLVALSPLWVAPARLLTGVASGLVVNASNALLVDSRRAGGRAGSVVGTTINQLSLAAGAVLATLVVGLWSLSAALFAGHLLLLACVAPLLRSVPRTAGVPARSGPGRSGRPVPRRVFVPAALAAFAAFAMCGLPAALAPTLAGDLLGAPGAVAGGLAVAIVFGGAGLSQPAWARLSDRVACRVSSALGAAALLLTTAGLAVASPAAAAVGVVLLGPAVGGLFMASLAIVNRFADAASRGRAGTHYFIVAFAGLVVPVVLTGVLSDALGQTTAVVVFCGVLLACLLVAATGIERCGDTIGPDGPRREPATCV